MSHCGKSPNGSPPHQNFMWDTKQKFQFYGYRVRNGLFHMVGNSKMDPPDIKASCGSENLNSNPMGIGLGMDYFTWREILKWIPPPSKLHVGHKIQISNLWV